jgi:hypothetical protein
VAYRLDEADKLTLIRSQVGMARRELVTEERDWASALAQDSANAMAEGVAFHHKLVVEIQQLEDGRCCESILQCPESRLSLCGPPEPFFAEEARQCCRNVAISLEEAPVIAHKA